MPDQWNLGDTTTAAKLNAYSTALDDIHGLVGDVVCQPLPPHTDGSGAVFTLVHMQRWLHYLSSGTVQSMDGAHELSISEKDNTFTALDLETVEWLSYGQMYQVVGVSMCCEDEEP